MSKNNNGLTEKLEATKAKVRKLLKLARDEGAMEGEVENAMRFARQLMDKYNLTEACVAIDEDPEGEKTMENMTVGDAYPTHSYMFGFAWAVCTVTDTAWYIMTSYSGKKSVRFYGLPHDVQVACELFDAVHTTAWAMSRAHGREVKREGLAVLPKEIERCRRSYLRGMSQRLQERAREMTQESKDDKDTGTQTTAIIVVKDAALSLYAEKKLNLRKGRSSSPKYFEGSSYVAGVTDGDKVSLSVNNKVGQSKRLT